MKIAVLVVICLIPLITIPVFGLSIEQKYLQRLQNVQSEAELNQILEDFTDEPAYQQMCRDLFERVTKEQQDLANFNIESMSIEQLKSNQKFVKLWEEFNETYQLFNDIGCMFTKSKWMPQEVKISSLTRAECDKIFKRKTALLEEYHKMLPEIVTGNEPYFVGIANQQDELDKQWKSECKPFEYFKGDIVCGAGTVKNEKGQCVPAKTTKESSSKSPFSGGCLIATATFGSELAPQVQMLREIRDNSLLQTKSGSAFMNGFNEFYYSFSPTIADWERQNPVFKEVVKLTITPLITSLSLLNYVDMDSEEEVLGYGISLILLNVGMYFVAPVGIVVLVRRYTENS